VNKRFSPLLAMLATTAALMPTGSASANERVPEPSPLPQLERTERGLSRPFSGGYGWGTSGPIVAKRYSKPEEAWTRNEIAAHAKSERRRLRDERNAARRAVAVTLEALS
jgi:hypothetical protein